jgi:hypothetical protein
MKKRGIICIIILILFLLIFNFLNAKPIEKHSYTKAICNKTNFCQDYEIKCENKKLISITPITGAFVQYFDLEYKNEINFCE